MADICSYNIHVKGSKKACYAFLTTTPALEEKEILFESGDDENYILHFTGICKWSLDFYCGGEYKGDFNLDYYTLEDIKDDWDLCGLQSISPDIKSKVLGVIAEIYTYSEEGMYKCFYRYEKGELTFEEENFIWNYLEEEYEEEFIWDKDEYENFEEFLVDYNLEDSGIKEEDFKHLEGNSYIRPGKDYNTSTNFTF